MSDIVERLREGVAHYDERDDAVMRQAADEIERLRRELSEARGLLGALAQRHEWVWPGMGPCVCKEHVAVRAALATTNSATTVR